MRDKEGKKKKKKENKRKLKWVSIAHVHSSWQDKVDLLDMPFPCPKQKKLTLFNSQISNIQVDSDAINYLI